MYNMYKCRNCANYPCTREECNIYNEYGCIEFESTVKREMLKLVKQEGLNWKFERI